MENDMGGIFLRSIGAARAQVGAGLMNLAYNLKRIEALIRHKNVYIRQDQCARNAENDLKTGRKALQTRPSVVALQT